MSESTADPQLLEEITAFVMAALELTGDREEIANSIQVIRDDGDAGIAMMGVESPEIGDSGFLIYYYNLASDGGPAHFEKDLQTLKTAGDQDIPGPRLMANANVGDRGFILATTPETYRKMMGPEPNGTETPQASKSPEEVEQLRRDSAFDLLMALTEANMQATRWLNAVEQRSPGEEDDQLKMNEEEIALAMHVLDSANVQDLLSVINLFVEWAKSSDPQSKS